VNVFVWRLKNGLSVKDKPFCVKIKKTAEFFLKDNLDEK